MGGAEKKQAAEAYLRRGRLLESGQEKLAWGNGQVVARSYFEASAKLGNTEAITTIGVFHSKGRGGLPINEEKALEAYKAASKLGNARAKRNLAMYHAKGRADLHQDVKMTQSLLLQVMTLSAPEQAPSLRILKIVA